MQKKIRGREEVGQYLFFREPAVGVSRQADWIEDHLREGKPKTAVRFSRLSRMPCVIGAAYVGALSLHFLNNRVVERNDYVRPFLGADFLCVIPGEIRRYQGIKDFCPQHLMYFKYRSRRKK